MIALNAWQLAAVGVGAVVLGVSLLSLVARTLRDRPRRRTSARDRLLRTNPWLAQTAQLHWTVRARRVHVDRLTTTLVGVALTLVTLRPVVTTADDGDR